MVVVTVTSIGGEVLWGPSELPPADKIGDVRGHVLRDQPDPHCHVRFLAGMENPSDTSTVQGLAGDGDALHLTGILEYKLLDQERSEYIKKLAGGQARYIFQQFP